MRNIQQIFDAVIAAGHYSTEYVGCFSSEYMCNAIANAQNRGTITEEEYNKADRCISEYMGKYFNRGLGYSLETALMEKNQPSSFKDRLVIYQNWAKRPRKFQNIKKV